MNGRIANLMEMFYNRPLLLTEEMVYQVDAVLMAKLMGQQEDGVPDAADRDDDLSDAERFGVLYLEHTGDPGTHIAVIEMNGKMVPRAGRLEETYSGFVGTERVGAAIRAAVDEGSPHILLLTDSGGGALPAVSPITDSLDYAREMGVKTTAYNRSMMASAAYWAAAHADEIVWSKTAIGGSIGVYAMHLDDSRALEDEGYKREIIKAGKNKGVHDRPLDESGRAALQELVDDAYGLFTDAVAERRGIPIEDLVGNDKDGIADGRVMTAQRALDVGLVDRIAPLHEVLETIVSDMGLISKTREALGLDETDNDVEVGGAETATAEDVTADEITAETVTVGRLELEALVNRLDALENARLDDDEASVMSTVESAVEAHVKSGLIPAARAEEVLEAAEDAPDVVAKVLAIIDSNGAAEVLGSDLGVPGKQDRTKEPAVSERRLRIREQINPRYRRRQRRKALGLDDDE